ncbi:hypothetical protein K1719_038437 [Acacia pycnantha]|nr:hypothetical protein K1719_038437 [Acacia pycnantha]
MAINILRRILHCFNTADPSVTNPASSAAPKRRLSTSLRDDVVADYQMISTRGTHDQDSSSNSSGIPATVGTSAAPPRPSKSMVMGTIFGYRRGHIWFCVQHNRLSNKPILLVEQSSATAAATSGSASSTIGCLINPFCL